MGIARFGGGVDPWSGICLFLVIFITIIIKNMTIFITEIIIFIIKIDLSLIL